MDYEDMKDVSWGVKFEITVDGYEVNFWDLPETAQHKILSDIAGDSYCGFFTY